MKPAAADLSRLGALAPVASELARAFVTLDSDIALLLDHEGVITQVVPSGSSPMAPLAQDWVGRRWVDTVTDGTRRKVELMLADVTASGQSRRREVNHRLDGGAELPVVYTALRLGGQGPVLAVGRDLRMASALQQRFEQAQQELEAEYWRARQVDTQVRQADARYLRLFNAAGDAMLTVDPQTLTIVEANEAACRLADLADDLLVGRQVAQLFEYAWRLDVERLLSTARERRSAPELRASMVGRMLSVGVTATAFSTGGGLRLLVRLRFISGPPSRLVE